MSTGSIDVPMKRKNTEFEYDRPCQFDPIKTIHQFNVSSEHFQA